MEHYGPCTILLCKSTCWCLFSQYYRRMLSGTTDSLSLESVIAKLYNIIFIIVLKIIFRIFQFLLIHLQYSFFTLLSILLAYPMLQLHCGSCIYFVFPFLYELIDDFLFPVKNVYAVLGVKSTDNFLQM